MIMEQTKEREKTVEDLVNDIQVILVKIDARLFSSDSSDSTEKKLSIKPPYALDLIFNALEHCRVLASRIDEQTTRII